MAIEAIFQKSKSLGYIDEGEVCNRVNYRLRDISFSSAMILDAAGLEQKVTLALQPSSGDIAGWHEFKISSWVEEITTEHCSGSIRIAKHFNEGQSRFNG